LNVVYSLLGSCTRLYADTALPLQGGAPTKEFPSPSDGVQPSAIVPDRVESAYDEDTYYEQDGAPQSAAGSGAGIEDEAVYDDTTDDEGTY